MTDGSILKETKHVLGLGADYTPFDQDVIMHINSIFGILHQLGVGPEEPFYIEDDQATWASFIQGSTQINMVKTYMYLRVRLLFDPPTTSFAIKAMEDQIREFEFRLNVVREEVWWKDPFVEEGIDS